MTGLLDIPAILLGLAALFGALNYWFVKLPHTIGLVVIALVASLAVVGLDLVVPTLGLSARVNGFLESLDFNVTLMQGMLSFLLFAWVRCTSTWASCCRANGPFWCWRASGWCCPR